MCAGLLLDEAAHARLVLLELEAELDDTEISTTTLTNLEQEWWRIPNMYSTTTQVIGNAWLGARESLALRVLSATLPPKIHPLAANNILLNPSHPLFSSFVQKNVCEVHSFDIRHYLE